MNCFKAFSTSLLIAGGFLAAPNPAAAETFTFDFLRCGVISCADVYQGEGVNHPQLVVHIFPKGGFLNAIDYTYIADFDPSGSGAFQLYFGNTLIQHYSPNEIAFIPEVNADAISPYGIYLSEGLELAFNAPQTVEHGWWPPQSVIEEVVGQAVGDIPSAIHAWDDQNGTGTPDEDGPDEGGGMSDAAIDGDLVEPYVHCQNMSLDGESCLDQAPQTLAIGNLAAATPPARTRATAIRTRFAPVLAAPRAAPLARLNRRLALQQSTAGGGPPGPSNCTNLGLANAYVSGGLAGCFEKCDICVQQDIEDWTFDVGKICGGAGTGTAFFAALLSEGLALPGAVAITTGVGGACAGIFLNDLGSMRMMRRKSCLDTCEYIDALAND